MPFAAQSALCHHLCQRRTSRWINRQAIGSVLFPQPIGTYQIEFSMGLERMGNFLLDTAALQTNALVIVDAWNP
ncbi:hypothetical protein [Leptolyngbya ohadii]|uniref:hypothetical protein n=1 Tax=Leptolyngbya ohadii TaxID=1962290 RepID=UPI000B59BA30|nr:hypothetical protein [Leptolyngbya ohadii]